MNTVDILKKLDACEESITWADAYLDPRDAWNACTDAGWMLWLLMRVSDSRAVCEVVCDIAEHPLDGLRKSDTTEV